MESSRQVLFSTQSSVIEVLVLSAKDRKMLQQQGVASSVVASSFKSVKINFHGRIYEGVGIQNRSKGMEFYCPELHDYPLTSGASDVTFMRFVPTRKSSECCCFFNFLDYLAFRSLQQRGIIKLHRHSDCIILNDFRNFIPMQLDSDDYEQVYMFFPHTDSGRIANKTMTERNRCARSGVVDGYADYESLWKLIRKKMRSEKGGPEALMKSEQ